MVMLPIFLVPLVGLAIDGTMLYIVQAKLSSAVDGAALGAGRLLGTSANTAEIAGEFLNVNFPTNYWGTNNLTPTITATNLLGTHTISVNATVSAPLLFLRILGVPRTTVSAYARATRRDTRVVLVLDHSGSMGSVIATMKAGASQFTGMFTPGYDELGLVGFSGSAIVGYPIYTPAYDKNPTSTTQRGPDTSFATSATTGPMFNQITAITANGGTNASEALALAYIELQKAHNRDVANGGDNSLNSIVFFTDGIPTSMAVSPNDPTNNALKAYAAAADATHSPCTYNVNHAGFSPDAAHTMAGWVTILGAQPPWTGNPNGLSALRAYDTNYTSNYWLANGLADYQPSGSPVARSPGIAGCSGLGNGGSWNLNDLAKIPPTDYYGNSTGSTDGGYAAGASHASTCAVSYDPNQPTNTCQWGLAIWNATDNVGKTIRTQGAMGSLPAPTGMLPITIYTIGYNGNVTYPVDPVLLKRLANTQDSSSYDSTQQVGMYIPVGNANNLAAAFAQVASSLLRLAR
jgi:Flp pilus assembly protein TadG